MSGLYRDQGVVLRSIKLGEADRIVSLMSQGHGKVRAVAKGIRKTGSKFGARLEPTSHVAFQCYRGRELDIVTQVETLDANRALREHYGRLTHAVSMLEAVDQVALEKEDMLAAFFDGGARRFFFKGTNGRWRDVLGDDDLALYEEAKRRALEPACAEWLERGWRG